MRKNTKRTKRAYSTTTKLGFVGVMVLLLIGASAGFLWMRGTTDETIDTSVITDNDYTRTEQSEGETFPVPENVPPEAIKNYQLITENEQFKIRKAAGSDSYIITLYAIINRPEQYDAYQQQLAQYKQNALQHLKERGIDTNKIEIVYEPEEAEYL